MRWLRNLTALFLLGFWLPATQHCDLEAAGLLAGIDCCSGNEGCAQDDCAVVESGHFKSGTGELKVPLPLVTLQRWEDSSPLVLAVPALEPGTLPGSRHEAAEAWLPQWRFAQRAAPLPGAPANS